MKEQHEISSKFVLVVGSRNSVSLGSILWKTTFLIDVFPLLCFGKKIKVKHEIQFLLNK